VALLVVVLLASSVMAWLGGWQLDRAREQGLAAAQRRLAAPPAQLSDLLGAREPFTGELVDRPVVATGTWDGERRLLVPDRRLAGVNGLWVLTPLRLADGSAVAVVRGWVPSSADPATAPFATGEATAGEVTTGEVAVTGILRPAEPPPDRLPGRADVLPPEQIERVDLTQLVQRWPYPLLTGYVLAQREEPAPVGPSPRVVPPDPAGTGLGLRNLSYAVQWWVFAGFGLFLWWRLVRDDHRGGPDRTTPAADPPERRRTPESSGARGAMA